MEPREKFSENLRRRRHALELSQEDLAHSSGLHATEISRLERAAREPRLSTIVRLAQELDTTAAELLRDV